MDVFSMYAKKISNTAAYRKALSDTVAVYRKAVSFFIDVAYERWDLFSCLKGQNEDIAVMESLTVCTKKRPSVMYEFSRADSMFYKMPSYLRRSAIREAVGKVSSYMSNLAGWEASDARTRGKAPGFPSAGYVYPVMYRDNMYESTGDYTARIKVRIRNTWDWIDIRFRKSDADYIMRRCIQFTDGDGVMKSRKVCAPTLQKRGKCWYLDFPVQEKVKLPDIPVKKQTVIAVDLGINNACTCVAMKSDGTVAGRHFLNLSAENDCLKHAVGRIKRAQRHGAGRMPRLWAAVRGINDDIAVKTAQFIVDTAVLYDADVIVMEHLDTRGKKHGSRKQRLHLWKCRYVQSMVTTKAHRLGVRIAHICAWNTSRLAFDGSGRVKRGKESDWTGKNYSLCEFPKADDSVPHGKIYHCDLNAALNVGARYFVRELTKSLPATAGQRLEAKVPSAVKRSTCTLSTLISLNAVLAA